MSNVLGVFYILTPFFYIYLSLSFPYLFHWFLTFPPFSFPFSFSYFPFSLPFPFFPLPFPLPVFLPSPSPPFETFPNALNGRIQNNIHSWCDLNSNLRFTDQLTPPWILPEKKMQILHWFSQHRVDLVTIFEQAPSFEDVLFLLRRALWPEAAVATSGPFSIIGRGLKKIKGQVP